MDNKNIFATNLKYYLKESGKSRQEICKALNISYYTFTDWIHGRKYPRMGSVEMLANYFGILKSDLIEEKTEEQKEMQKNNDAIADIVVRLRTDEDFLSAVQAIEKLDREKLSSLLAFLK